MTEASQKETRTDQETRIEAPLGQLPGYDSDLDIMDEHRLFPAEIYWRDHYFWLEERGYRLRSRYHPDWVASWKDTDKSWLRCEDSQVGQMITLIISATRISDGAPVILKRLFPDDDMGEVEIARLLSAPPNGSHPSNHCMPAIEVLDFPEENTMFLVSPFFTAWGSPAFVTVGEAVEFFRQIFQGLQFMHNLDVAHNDIKFDNIMMDSTPLYDEPIHPVNRAMNLAFTRRIKPRMRTLHPVRYYYIDFGNAKQYYPKDEPPRILLGPLGYGGDLTVPEFKTGAVDCDPFPVDIYRVGNLIRETFLDGDEAGEGGKRGFNFMRPLVRDMCHKDPTKRPVIGEVVSRFEKIVRGLHWWTLRSRCIDIEEPLVFRMVLFPVHWAKQIPLIIRRIPAIPRISPT